MESAVTDHGVRVAPILHGFPACYGLAISQSSGVNAPARFRCSLSHDTRSLPTISAVAAYKASAPRKNFVVPADNALASRERSLLRCSRAMGPRGAVFISLSASAKHAAKLQTATADAGPMVPASARKAKRRPSVTKSFILRPVSEAWAFASR